LTLEEMAELLDPRSQPPPAKQQAWSNEWLKAMTQDRKAQEWAELKRLEKEFFQELQFVSAQVRKIKRDGTEFRTWIGMLISLLLLLVLLLVVQDFWS